MPLVLGILAGLGLTTYVVVATIVSGVNPMAIPIIVAVGVVGTGIGLYVGHLFRSKVNRKR